MDRQILIRWEDTEYRALCHVPADLGVRHGAMTEDGPWVAGRGKTVELTMDEMFRELGRAYFGKLCREMPVKNAS